MGDTRAFTDHSYAAFLAEKRLMGARCSDCKALFVPPRALCPDCHGERMSWEAVSGRGRIAALTCMTMVSVGLAAEGYGPDRPYCTGVIALEEGPRVVARLAGANGDESGSFEIGAAMQAGFEQLADGTARLVFQPA